MAQSLPFENGLKKMIENYEDFTTGGSHILCIPCNLKYTRIFKQNRILSFKPKFRHTFEGDDEAKRLDFCLEMSNRVLNDMQQKISTDKLDELPLSYRTRMFFKQDGCPAHHAVTVRNWLNSEFNEHWIGRDGPILWPPRSSDLIILDFYLWGRLNKLFIVNH
ncbi:hypothetical protein NQ318_002251 [Aromia moschata]|uniref:Uncharacterized protein n=1 Tax=Aromia moschata TaxID=1265417 RepID=A0AAV8Z540_9CUCU|nr:hypothetical protein NQ318_002251 [Aromia moschata]